jgi:hypothetical protein
MKFTYMMGTSLTNFKLFLHTVSIINTYILEKG